MSVTTTTPERVSPEGAPERGYTSPVERLSGLLHRADAAQGDARRAATSELNRALGGLARFASRPVADLLLRWLDQGALSDLQDGEGQTARAAATAALLSMGYPYALEISPDDLDHLRSRTAVSGGQGGAMAAFLMVSVTSGFSVMQQVTDPGAHGVAGGLAMVGVLFASALAVLLTRPRGAGRRWALLAMLVSGLVAMSVAVSGGPALLAPAIGAVAAFGMGWPRRGS